MSQREQAFEVLGGLLGEPLVGHAAQHRQVIRHIAYVLRQVRLTAMGDRGQIRRVGFHQQTVGRYLSRHVAQGIGIAERDLEP